MQNKLRIEYHILQSFPVTCLNRDDVGAPKSAVVGGVPRARVSSQCWKRQVRLALQEFGIKLGVRTAKVSDLFARYLTTLEASDDSALKCAQLMANALLAKEKKQSKGKAKAEVEVENESTQDKENKLLYISDSEAMRFALFAKKHAFDLSKFDEKKLLPELIKVSKKEPVDALDIALFGRMVAKAAEINVEAATSFSQALSTHRVTNDLDFFTAVDDDPTAQGSAHMGSLEFNAATYYRYISLDLGQLAQTLGPDADLKAAIEAFTKALFVAVPSARQTTMAGAASWDFAKVLVRRGQGLQASFEKAIKPDGGYLQPSITALKDYLGKKEKLAGSLFGKVGDYEWGEDENFSIDDLIARLQSHIPSLQAE